MDSTHRDLVFAIYDALSRGDESAIQDMFTDDFVDHAVPKDLPPTRRGLIAWMRMMRDAFPDLRLQLLDMISESDRVACLVRITGTHTGEFMGMMPTGRHIEVQGLDYAVVRDGRCCEHWGFSDDLALLGQLGVVPLPAQRSGDLAAKVAVR
jgi:steroid delta-isomerase-like uncharacterized protein